MRAQIPKLGDDPNSPFPDFHDIEHTEGLIAWGGDLHPTRLLNAYHRGIFPWFEPQGPILWWSPDPRPVIVPGTMRISRRLRRELRQAHFRLTLDQAFPEVIAACAAPRGDGHGTWLTDDMQQSYTELHRLGHAHSLEVWHPAESCGRGLWPRQDSVPYPSGPEGPPTDAVNWQLTGGVYGIAIGKLFFAESKFHRRTNASKIALAALQHCLKQWEFLALDCQIWNPHLDRLGARLVSRADFEELLRSGLDRPDRVGSWRERLGGTNLAEW